MCCVLCCLWFENVCVRIGQHWFFLLVPVHVFFHCLLLLCFLTRTGQDVAGVYCLWLPRQHRWGGQLSHFTALCTALCLQISRVSVCHFILILWWKKRGVGVGEQSHSNESSVFSLVCSEWHTKSNPNNVLLRSKWNTNWRKKKNSIHLSSEAGASAVASEKMATVVGSTTGRLQAKVNHLGLILRKACWADFE